MERDDNSEWKQQQDEEQQWIESQKPMNAMSDEEFFQCIGSIEQEVAKHL